jgi:uncharacterized protein YceK
MSRSGLFVCFGLLVATLSGCHQTDNHTATASTASASSIPIPAANADDTTWGNYLSAQGKLHNKDVAQRPYIYVIPGGDSSGAADRRKSEMDSISHGIGPILMPGGMLIVGGPDAQQTLTFMTGLSKIVKANGMKGIVVLVVGGASQANAVTDALKPTGATVRFAAM